MDGHHRISGRRAAENQSLYRSINEQIKDLNEPLGEVASNGQVARQWFCECADTRCMIRIAASLPEYETVRSNPRTFMVALGHVVPEAERVVTENDRFMMVEKFDIGGQIAEALDPRHTPA